MRIYGDLAFRIGIIAQLLGHEPSLDVGGYSSGHHLKIWSSYAAQVPVSVNLPQNRPHPAATWSDVPTLWGDGRVLPFADNSIPDVFTTDVLEHVAPGDRKLIVDECCRVASRNVMMLFPYWSTENRMFEYNLERMLALHAYRMPGLVQHSVHGLPSESSIIEMFDSRKWGATVRKVGSRQAIMASVVAQMQADSRDRISIAEYFGEWSLRMDEQADPYRTLVTAKKY